MSVGRTDSHRAAWSLGLGIAVLLGAWLGPLPGLVPISFAAHMAMHVLVVAVAAPLLSLGLAGTSRDPAVHWPRAFAPLPAALLDLLVIWAWHAPALHQAARTGAGALALEQAGFLAVGLLVWLSAFGGDHESRPERRAAGIVGLLLTSMHMTLLGALLTLSPRPLYGHSQAAAAFGLSPLDDLHLGGMLMLLFGGVVYLAGGLYLLGALLRDARPRSSS